MKPAKTFFVFILAATATLFFSGCKKDKKSEPAPPPVTITPDFSFPGLAFYTGDSIHFYSTAPAGTPLFWNFGDGYTSTDFTPVHAYKSYGTYYVTLIMNNDNNQKKQKSIFIDQYHIQLVYDLPLIPGKNIYFTSSAPYNKKFLWNFGDSSSSTDVRPNHSYAHSGTYNVSLILDNDSSHILYSTVNVSVYPSQTHHIAGAKSWHHNYYGYFTNGSISIYNTYADTSFAINYVDDFTLSAGLETFHYQRSDDSTVYFDGNYNISYNFINGSTKFYKRIPYTGVGHSLWYYVDNFYTY